MDTLMLNGTTYERVVQALDFAKKHNKHKLDIKWLEKIHSEAGVPLIESARKFYEDYGGIFIDTKMCDAFENSDGTIDIDPFDFTFKLFCRTDQTEEEIKENLDIYQPKNISYMIGEIGHYYPAVVWINKDGGLVISHDYERESHEFDSLAEFIAWEIDTNNLTLDAVREIDPDEEY
ncbi:MAG: hypothetical protein MJ211_11955 [Bacteroidales bacterium]|nr:hypothetical protein [Bacteroidales bacterium]